MATSNTVSSTSYKDIPYYTCSQSTYNRLTKYDDKGLYYIHDTNVVYKGSKLYSKAVAVVSAFPTSQSQIAPGRLYINTTTGVAKIYENGVWKDCFSFNDTTSLTGRVNDLEEEIKVINLDIADLYTKISTSSIDKTFVFTQAVASNVWSIAHNLNKYPSVTVVDSAGDLCLTNIKYVDLNNVTISFMNATSGMATLN